MKTCEVDGGEEDAIRGGSDEQRETVSEAKRALWDDWCSEGHAVIESRGG